MTQTIAAALRQGAQALTAVSGATARREASLLLAHVLGVPATRLTTHGDDTLSDKQQSQFKNAIDARQAHQPIAQIIGRRAFWEHDFRVTGDVLDPRPDTELLVELALAVPSPARVLDLGTGSGCILCSVLAARSNTTGLGVDISEAALQVARANAAALGLGDRASFQTGFWFDGLEGQFDLILSNPPYISASEFEMLDRDVRDWEPRAALTDGADGLAAYRAIAAQLGNFLVPGGTALFEHGARQAHQVAEIFRKNGFHSLASQCDLNGKPRVLSVTQ